MGHSKDFRRRPKASPIEIADGRDLVFGKSITLVYRHFTSLFRVLSQSAMLSHMENRSLNDVGGTPGGLGQFLLGFAMACVGGFLITHQVSVIGSYWSFWGGTTFGVTLLPMLFGVAIVFWNGKSLIGWLLTVAGALFILAGIIANLHIYFQPTSLFNTMVMLILLVGGLALIAKSIRPHQPQKSQ